MRKNNVMEGTGRIVTFKMFAVLLMLVLFSAGTMVFAQQRKAPSKEYNGNEADKVMPGASYVKEGRNNFYPSYVRLNATTSVHANDFTLWLKSAVKTASDIDFKLIKQDRDPSGMEHIRYMQTYKGIPVIQTTYIAHVKNGMVTSFNGHAVNLSLESSAVPALNESAALDAAKHYMGAERYMWEDNYWENNIKERTKDPKATYFPKGELCWYAVDFNIKEKAPAFKLAYRFDINAASPTFAKRVYVDAGTGAILNTEALESNCNATTVNTVFNGNRGISTDKFTANDFRLRDDCQAAEIRIRDWNSSNCTSSPVEIQNTTNTWNNNNNETFGGTVLWATKQSYLYWLNARSRSGYNGSNGDVEGYINAVFSSCSPSCCAYTDNASMSFSGGTLKVGLGSSGTLANSWCPLDVIGHEFTHAVTGSSAQLVYQDESGALNESFSDIFGEATENYVLGSNDWLVGNDRTSGNIRSMSNPNAKGDPDTYDGSNWCDYTNAGLNCTMNDAGGVHTNSGVQNFWFYLLTVGGSGTNDNGDAYTVSGLGLGTASAIAGSNLLNHLSSNSDYSDARDGAIDAAIDLYGACSNEVKQTTNAWYAVGVGSQYFDATASVTSNYNGRDVTCFNACNGSATVNVVSGFFPTYQWSNGATTQSISNLCPNTYTVTVTNLLGLGCSVTRSVTIQNTPQLTVSPVVTSNYNGYGVSCNGGNDGTAKANPAGGTTPYSYNWSNGQTTNVATGLSATTYTVTVTDVNGCSASGSVTLTQPPPLTTTAAPITNYNGYNVRCHGGSDGAAQAYPVGGVAPYTYNWSGGKTTNPATGLSAGTYTVTVTDANGCTAVASTTLTEPPPLTIDAGSNKIVYWGYPDSSCATLKATGVGGGVPPYVLTWSTGSHAASINVCPTATTVYYVTVKDKNNCTLTDSVKVCVIDVRCGNKLDKVELCHKTGSASNPSNTLCVALPAAKTHLLGHGDELAFCGIIKVCNYTMRMDNSGEELINEKGTYLNAFPNPFSSYTTIRFKLSKDVHTEVGIFDISGRAINTLFNGEAIADNIYDLTFDGSEFNNGIYFLMLKTETGETEVRKVILVR